MIRAVTIASLTALLLLVLYLPSACPPLRFLDLLQTEHAQLAAFWGPARAERVLSRTLDAQNAMARLMPIPNPRDAPRPDALDTAVASEMVAVNTRLFENTYFRSAEALLTLASYRAFTLLAWLPWLASLGVAAVVDGAVVRSIKAKRFAHHDPEAFAACTAAAVVVAAGTLVGLVLPTTMPPLLLPAVQLAMMVLVAGSIRNFHSRAAA